MCILLVSNLVGKVPVEVVILCSCDETAVPYLQKFFSGNDALQDPPMPFLKFSLYVYCK